MTVLQDVADYVTRLGKPVCDDCIADHLKLTVRQHANHKTRELEKDRSFDRRKGTCSVCHNEKLVIRKRLK